ncbi:CHASE domain-containing protein [Massilia jejuensis]|uniref:CHASE domain-containing protein n=1 Tax=Massilia jejuensis TaxID=648894 RepID=A0ABW0PHG7_9BURK
MGITRSWITKFNAIGMGSWMGALLSLSVGVALYISTSQAIENDARTRFDHMARSVQSTLDGRFKTYADLLRSTASLFLTTEQVTRETFQRYVAGLDLPHHFPGVESINFAQYLTDAERDRFEAHMLRNIDGRGRNARILPEGRRTEYTVLTFVEPGTTWIKRIGFDLHTAIGAVELLAHSRDTGEVLTSGAPVNAGSLVIGLTMRLPVYGAPMPLPEVGQRRAAYLGTVGIGFSVDSLAQGVLDNMPRNATRLVISGTAPGKEPGSAAGGYRRNVFFDNRPGLAADEQVEFRARLPVGVDGRGWDIDFSVTKRSLYSRLDRALPWVAMLAGIIGTALLYALFQTLSCSRRHAIGLAEEMTGELRASEAKLKKTNENLRRLAAHAENIKESERKRIAREIHDDLGQNLLALRIEVDLLASRTGRHPHLNARTRWMLEQIDATIKSVRQIINDLRPNVLDLGLTAAVDWQIAEFQRRTGLSCELVSHNHDLHVSDRCATTLFRILQESLTNVSRHARATKVRVELAVDPESISMTVSDNGVGLTKAGGQKPGSFGLVGIEERVRILSGKCIITSGPQAGTTVHISIPAANNLLSVSYVPASPATPHPAFDSM